MPEMSLVYEGNGRFRTASRVDLLAANEAFEQGEVIEVKAGKKRSMPQHRWFFAMVAKAYDNQSAGPVFADEERLRKWLLIKAGHCDEKRFAPGSISKEMAAWLRQTYSDIDLATDGQSIIVRTAKSISRRECDHETMCGIADAAIEIIMTEIVPGSRREDWEPVRVRKAA